MWIEKEHLQKLSVAGHEQLGNERVSQPVSESESISPTWQVGLELGQPQPKQCGKNQPWVACLSGAVLEAGAELWENQ